MKASTDSRLVFRVLAVFFIVAMIVPWIFASHLVESAYSGNSLPAFYALVTGQAVPSVQDFLDVVRPLLIAFSVIAITMSAFAMILSNKRSREIIQEIEHSAGPFLLLVIALSWLVVRASGSIDLPHFGDEDEKVVAAWLIFEGEKLYGDIFAHHGPVNYIFAHAVYAFTESKGLAPYRVAQWVIVALGGVALAASPVFFHWRQRLYAAATFLILAATLYPVLRGHELLYHVHCGIFFITAFSLLFLPIILGRRVPAIAAGVAGSAIVALAFSAYPFVVPISLMFLSVFLVLLAQNRMWMTTRELVVPIAIGCILMLSLIVAWLILYSNIAGYFVYHLYFNQKIYSPFIDFDALLWLKQVSLLAQPKWGFFLWIAIAFVAFLLLAIFANINCRKNIGNWRSSILLVLGAAAMLAALFYLNPRGDGSFKMAALAITSIGLFSIILAMGFRLGSSVIITPILNISLALGLFTLILLTQFSPLLGSLSANAVISQVDGSASTKKRDDEIIEAIQLLVKPSERILALVFNPRWYLLTERRPASGHFYYLPWQAAYSRHPVLGQNIDICADLKRAQPKAVIWDRWTVWNKYHLQTYEPCLYELITTQYDPLEGMPEVLRKRELSTAQL